MLAIKQEKENHNAKVIDNELELSVSLRLPRLPSSVIVLAYLATWPSCGVRRNKVHGTLLWWPVIYSPALTVSYANLIAAQFSSKRSFYVPNAPQKPYSSCKMLSVNEFKIHILRVCDGGNRKVARFMVVWNTRCNNKHFSCGAKAHIK